MKAVRKSPNLFALMRRYHPGVIMLVASAVGAGVSVPNTFLRTYAAEIDIPQIGLFFATIVLGLLKAGLIVEADRTLYFALCGLAPLAGVGWAFLRRIDAVAVAAAIDRTNRFDDRLASAFQFAQDCTSHQSRTGNCCWKRSIRNGTSQTTTSCGGCEPVSAYWVHCSPDERKPVCRCPAGATLETAPSICT